MNSKKGFIHHRQYFLEKSNFVQVSEIKDKEKLKLIHFTYRLTYLRDCGLAYFIDEGQMIFIKIVSIYFFDPVIILDHQKLLQRNH